MLHHLAAVDPGHDSGVRDMAALSARLAYASMCLTVTWGVLTSTGWVNRITGRQALRGGHQVLATLTLAFACVHAAAFLLLHSEPFTVARLVVPFTGSLRHTFGVLALEGMLAAAVVVALRRWTSYWRWLWLHRLAYPAFAAGLLHSFFGALANNHLAAVWLGGITLLVPAVTMAVLRFLPARTLATAGLVEDAP